MQDTFLDDYESGDGPTGLQKAFFPIVKWGGALLSLAVLGLLIFWSYSLGVRDAREIPVIEALKTPARVVPDEPGGTEMAHKGLEVNEILAGGAAGAPDDADLAPEAMSLTDEDDLLPEELVETALTPEPSVDEDTATAEELLELIRPSDAPFSTVPSAEETETAAVEEPADNAAPRPRARPGGFNAVATTPVQTAALTPEAPAPVAAAPTGPTPVDPAALPAGTLLLQLGAFDSAGQAEAQWSRLIGAHSDLLAGKQHYVQRANSNGRIFHRLRVMGFDGRTAQRAVCDSLQARAVDCIPVTVR
ncbi:MAG: SPOR domain-containing protein [Pseudomonadota bacterium]